jgi:hypothetical protein
VGCWFDWVVCIEIDDGVLFWAGLLDTMVGVSGV